MDLKFAFICDYAERESKLHAIGIGWDRINTHTLPAIHPMMTFVASLRGSIAEQGTKDVQVRLIDADGEDVIPSVGQQLRFDVAPGALEGSMNLIIQMGGIEFRKYGAYAIHLVVQGSEMASVPFSVVQIPSTS